MTWRGLQGECHFKKPELEEEEEKRHKGKEDKKKRDKKGEVGEVKFGERLFIKRARGDSESQRDAQKKRQT